MNYYEIVEAAKKMDIEYTDTTDEKFLATFPKGWMSLLTDAAMALSSTSYYIDRLTYNKGVLRIHLKNQAKDELDGRIAKWICSAVAKDSAQTCMITGKYGIRRKSYDGWPCLSKEVFIEYANQYEDNNGTEGTEATASN